jgi:hypothetical protein
VSRRERQRACPAGAVGWTPRDGWAFDVAELPTHVDDGDYVLTVSADGLVRGVTAVTGAPLLALLRVEADVAELVEALHDVAEAFAQRLAARDGDPS